MSKLENIKLAWHRWKKRLLITAAVLAVLWVAGCAGLYRIMREPPEQFARFMAKLPGPVPFLLFPFETLWTQARAGRLHTGDSAPDFSLAKLDHTATIQLADLTAQHRPVVLVFGSYT
ncbi:MAG: hypothetical protein WB729_03035 [Candidatus Sulfotelmatobacter sp.]